MNAAAERSAVYGIFARSFSYAGTGAAPFRISGADFNDAFDPAVNADACSLRERAHVDHDQSALFEELMRFYEFFGLTRDGDADAELPDHLSVELEFMHVLTHLESQLGDRPDTAAAVRRAQHDFLTRHVAALVGNVRQKLRTAHPECLRLVASCQQFIDAELATIQAEPLDHFDNEAAAALPPGGVAAGSPSAGYGRRVS